MLKPYYQDSSVTLYHGDNRVIVPQLGRFDLLLTDPPYGIGEGNQKRIMSRGKLARPRDYGDANWDNETPDPWVLQMVFGKCESRIVWGGNYFDGLGPARGWLVWDKDNGSNDFADCELAWTNLEMAVRKFKWRWNGMLQENMADKEIRQHPTQKPLALFAWCLSFAPECKTVLDAWAGSGTTGRACKDLGKQCVMIEQEEQYCEVIARRMQQEVLNLC
jgi:DNA modification methylase